ncbi:MAG: hypothetical protein IKD28_02600 [Clostridia bacterium]|nr:hypothetical protein [Clostridia bacterium]
MKRLIAILLLAVLAFSLVSCAADDDTPEGMQNVSTEDAMFNLYVPASWVPQTVSGIPGACVSSADGSNVFAYATMLDDVIEDTADATAAERYWNEVCKPLFTTDLKDFSELSAEGLTTVTSTDPVTLGGKNATKVFISFTSGGVAMKGMMVVAVLDGTKAYHFCYFAKAEKFADYLSQVESDILPVFTFRA